MTPPTQEERDEAEAATEARMRETLLALTQVWPGCEVVLLLRPSSQPPDAGVSYIGTGTPAQAKAMVRAALARMEGRILDAPRRLQ